MEVFSFDIVYCRDTKMYAISVTGSVTTIKLEKDSVDYKIELIMVYDTWI